MRRARCQGPWDVKEQDAGDRADHQQARDGLGGDGLVRLGDEHAHEESDDDGPRGDDVHALAVVRVLGALHDAGPVGEGVLAALLARRLILSPARRRQPALPGGPRFAGDLSRRALPTTRRPGTPSNQTSGSPVAATAPARTTSILRELIRTLDKFGYSMDTMHRIA